MNSGTRAAETWPCRVREALRWAELRYERMPRTAAGQIMVELLIPVAILHDLLFGSVTLLTFIFVVLYYGVLFFCRYRGRTLHAMLSCALSALLCMMTATIVAAEYLIRASGQKTLTLLQQANPDLHLPEQVSPGWGLWLMLVLCLLLCLYELVLTTLKVAAFTRPGLPLASALASRPDAPPA